jgi:serine/threonine protein kinase
MWSLGVIIYAMLVGYPPFSHPNGIEELQNLITTTDYEFDEVDWSNISIEAIDLIEKLLVPDTQTRLTAS